MFGKGAPRCPRCNKSVYFNEEVVAAGKKWHNTCFRCCSCGQGLSSNNLHDRDGEIYCTTCYGKEHGPKGFGYGNMLTETGIQDNRKPTTSQVVRSSNPRAAEVKTKPKGSFCSECGHGPQTGKFCSECGTPIAQKTVAAAPAQPKYSAPAPAKSVPSVQNTWKAKTNTSGYKKPSTGFKLGGGNKCGACGKSVYFNEEVVAAGKKFHNTCFRCTTCRKGLESNTLADKDGVLYCTTCYAKNFGPKGYGFGGGDATTMAYTR